MYQISRKSGEQIFVNELSLASHSTLIIMASNIVSGKGQLDLIKSMERIGNEFDDVHLLIAGTAC